MFQHIKLYLPKPTLFKFTPLQLCSQSILIHSKLFCPAITARQFQTFLVNEKSITKYNSIWLDQSTEKSKSTFRTTTNFSPFFPYGKSDFVSIRKSKQFFIDKTEYIPLLEQYGEQLFFVRPPRWGKTLLLTMLSAYYDISMKDQFDELFGELWIGKKENWTLEKNQFHILHLDFSIEIKNGAEEISKNLHNIINSKIFAFVKQYKLEDQVTLDYHDAFFSFRNLVECLKLNNLKFMVLIDEYDRFVNKLMFENPELIVTGNAITSPIQSFFEQLKWASKVGLTEFRSVIVGILPIALTDAFGYTVAKNITFEKQFGEMVGFTEANIRQALKRIEISDKEQEYIIQFMQKYYHGYHFYGTNNSLFNSTQSLFFLDKYLTNTSFQSGVLSNKFELFQLMDENIKIGENVLQVLARTREIKLILIELFSIGEIQVQSHIRSVVTYREIVSLLHDTESTLEFYRDHWDLLLSFMFYHGMITCSQESLNTLIPRRLVIPNVIYGEQFLPIVQRIAQAYEIATFLTRPSEKSLKAMIWSILNNLDTMCITYFYEVGLQGVVESALKLFCKFQNSAIEVIEPYDKTNEYSKRSNIVLSTMDDIYVIEFKRIRINDLKEFRYTPMPTPLKYKQLCCEFEQKSENELLEMELTFQDQNSVNVGDRVTQSIEQVKKLEKERNFTKMIHKFVAVQVFYPIVVRKIE